MNKPTIPNEVADVIEDLRDNFMYTNKQLVSLAMRNGGETHPDTVTLQSIPFDKLMKALVNGYEREMTEEERAHDTIREQWEYAKSIRHRSHTYSGFAEGIWFTLETLSIKIKGVND